MAVPAQISMTNGFDIDPGSGAGCPTGLTSGSSLYCPATSVLGVAQNLLLNSSPSATLATPSQEVVLRIGQFWYM